MILFVLQFILTNIIFSVITCTTLIRLNREKVHSSLEILLYSLGLGPILTSLLLYYLFFFFPFRTNLFYFLAVIGIYLIMLTMGRKYLPILFKEIAEKIKGTKKKFANQNPFQKMETVVVSFVLILLLASFSVLYFTNTLQTPLDGSDALKYGTLGKILFAEKSLEYRWIRPYPKSGFYLISNHAPSFSLLLTWEKITDSFFAADKDIYYKSVGTYYGLLILMILFLWLSRKSKYLALLGVFALLSGISFLLTLIQQHLDSFRIFFLLVSWIFLAYSIQKKDVLSFVLLGAFSGFAAFSHSIGAVISVLNCLALFIFLEGSLKYKLEKVGLVIVLVIAFGWFHYIYDILWGFGWLIFKRDIPVGG